MYKMEALTFRKIVLILMEGISHKFCQGKKIEINRVVSKLCLVKVTVIFARPPCKRGPGCFRTVVMSLENEASKNDILRTSSVLLMQKKLTVEEGFILGLGNAL